MNNDMGAFQTSWEDGGFGRRSRPNPPFPNSNETHPNDIKSGVAAGVQVGAGIVLLLWLGAVPAGARLAANLILQDLLAPGLVTAVAIFASATLLLPVFVGVALFTRHRAHWQPLAALAASGVAVSGYLLLDACVRTALPQPPTPALYGEGAGVAAARLATLLPYTLLAAWLIPKLARAPRRSLWAWLGLDRIDIPMILLALAVALLVTFPWPLVGSLGDSLTSLSLMLQTLADAAPSIVIIWGIVFCLLTATFRQPWLAALTAMLLYGIIAFSTVLHTDDFVNSALTSLLALPLAFLLAELRARRSGVYPLLLVALCYYAIPALFVDPRNALTGGPEITHLLGHVVGWSTALVIGPLLWGERKLLHALRDRLQVPGWARWATFGLTALFLCGAWGGVYVFAGKPGFYNDGFLVILDEQADLGDAYTIADRETRIQYVYDTLVETAERTQAPLREELDRLSVPYRPYYIINMIRVDGHRWLAGRFENQPGVAQVLLNPNVREYPNRTPIPYPASGPVNGVQPNLTAINADDAWALGITGEGIVVAGQDTGYDWTHPVLKPHYRGWDGTQASHDYTWHDAWDNTDIPFDDDSHGTHTMGTVLGDDGASGAKGHNRTGVAPGAQWIGCRNMRRGVGNPGSYAACMEFFLAPYPHDGDPFADGDVRLAPHVINNSWGCPYWEGCFAETFVPAIDALHAAGIIMIVSAGNDGPNCSTATVPPANYERVFSIGATDNDGDITDFSSRGPIDGLLKPDITAPGNWVRSSIPGGSYASVPGTSMAGPHVAGTVALIWSADPSLIGDIETTERILCETATPRHVEFTCTTTSTSVCACGDTTGSPNNVYGCGFVDAGAAVQAALERAQ